MNYLILQHPGHNRVYYKLADKLALAELKLASQSLSTACVKIEVTEIEQIRYLLIETEAPLSPKDIQLISRLSFVFAIYEMGKVGDRICLFPIAQIDPVYLDSKISSLLKYKGKTNELFTKMMIHVGLLSSEFAHGQKIQMLDPVAGKGTTLFEGAVYGFDVFGIEIEPKSVHEATIFFKKYLETERLKHNSSKRQIAGKSKSEAVHIHEFGYARTKQEFKSKETVKKLGMICGNSQEASKYFKKNQFHLIVGDLPYGIVHGNTGERKASSITRNPSELLEACLPAWQQVLRKGGCLVLAWNAFVASKQKLSEIVNQHGLQVLSDPPYDEFQHMVDKSIKRDILVAKKV